MTASPTTIRERVAASRVEDLAITWLVLDPKNPTNREPLDELIADVRKHGVLQAIIVRPCGMRSHAGSSLETPQYEVVAGNRRVVAASAASLERIPARVLELDDAELVEVQAVENLQRADLSPIDECETYERLLEEVEGGVPEVAARAGVEQSRVWQRLALRGLPKAAREMLRKGELELTVALAVARIPDPKLREKAATEVTRVERGYSDAAEANVEQRMSVTEALAYIRGRYMLRLADATFDRANAELVPGAGACGPCPKRTGGNAAGLFGDLLETPDGTELCTDPKCFEAKSAAAWDLAAEKHRKAGHEVLDAAASAKVFSKHQADELKHDGPWRDLDAAPNYYTSKTWRQLLGKHVPEQLTVARDGDGKARWLAKESTLTRIAKEEGVKIPAGYEGSSGGAKEKPSAAEKTKQKKRLFARKLLQVARPSVFRTIAINGASPKTADGVLRHAIAELEEHAYGRTLEDVGRVTPGELVAARRGETKKQKLAALAKGLKGLDLVGLLAELLFARRMLMGAEHEWGDEAEALAKDTGTDLRAIEDGAKPLVDRKYHRMLMTAAERAKDDETRKAADGKRAGVAPKEKTAKPKKGAKS